MHKREVLVLPINGKRKEGVMDPHATLERAMSAMRRNDAAEASAALRDLADWIDKGGYMPYMDAEECV